MIYPWYKEISFSDELQQGDFIPDCPIVVPPVSLSNIEDIQIDIKQLDSIILSQSCDLVNSKIEIVLVCPYISLREFLISSLPQNPTKKEIKNRLESLKKGHLPGYHLLNKVDEDNSNTDHIVVDFKNVYGIQIAALKQIVSQLEKRRRLLSPYKEHLSQAFARYFMRVGLPHDIDLSSYAL